ncbi:aliphatic sulfonate ABC transporter substrate-binding protein [Beijerinckia sp. L45]|uniref:aliphatic sulfonate ABC transporter substrate-binding protein n=1 Tax=Beijerinckia sp. L45 TaxID=1641855 RepID=UPI00131CF109|nr:aliphatic sulfonate ABC transporter substrate-binding protein [Beijerinckia sp. L45]
MTVLTRRALVGASAAMVVVSATPGRAAGKVMRVGYQKYGNLLLLKTSGVLESKLRPLGYDVEWREFLSGPPLMEALGAGAIDFGTAGETPPIFAQAAGSPILYLGTEPPAPRSEAILVPEGSTIKTLADLRGKRIALNKGSNVHVLYVRALEKAGIAYKDVTTVYLSPPDGRAAFERKSVDAWVIWDPYLAAAQAAGNTRVLADATGLAANRQFYLGTKRFTDQAAIAAFKAAVTDIDAKTIGATAAAATVVSPAVGLPEPIVATALARQTWGIGPVDAGIVGEQQATADTFFKLGLIPRAIRIADAIPA